MSRKDAIGHNPWRPLLRAALYARPVPLVVSGERVTPGASLWSGARAWVARFRQLGLEPGDRVVHAIEPGPGAIMALTACLWEGLTVAMTPPGSDAVRSLETFDARLVLGEGGIRPVDAGVPDANAVDRRAGDGPQTPSVRFILSTSGTGGRPKHAAISDQNALSVIETHSRALVPDAGWSSIVAMSVLPWHHAFGLVIDLLPLVLGGATVVRTPSGGRDREAMLDAADRWGVNWMSMVPLQAERLGATTRGRALLTRLVGGVIGGAPVTQVQCDSLRSTRLRAGYGQTEASPGVTLGEPGEWSVGWIGRPVGCVAHVSNHGTLRVRGQNVCQGAWVDGKVIDAEPDRWLDTNDIVEPRGHGYRFVGRRDDSFKLSNGRLVDAPQIERALVTDGAAHEAVVLPDETGVAIDIVLVQNAHSLKANHDRPDIASVGNVLGPLFSRVRRVIDRASDAIPRTSKGSPDRRALAREMTRLGDTPGRREKEPNDDHDLGPTVVCPSRQVA